MAQNTKQQMQEVGQNVVDDIQQRKAEMNKKQSDYEGGENSPRPPTQTWYKTALFPNERTQYRVDEIDKVFKKTK